jgi:hypothetical protein
MYSTHIFVTTKDVKEIIFSEVKGARVTLPRAKKKCKELHIKNYLSNFFSRHHLWPGE